MASAVRPPDGRPANADGREVAFVLDAPPSGPYAGKGGLYVGEFPSGRRVVLG